MSAGHTPGPWKACKDGDCPCGAIWDATGEIHLATAFDETALGMDCFGSDIGVSRAERIANARLIAAAPDLLEHCAALILLAKMLAKMAGVPDAEFEEAVAPSRAAIAKATGQ